MVQIQKILCPVDQSEASGRALDYALMLSRWYDASLTAVEVAWAGLPSVSTVAPTVLTPEYLQESAEALQRFVGARAGDVAVTTKLVHGQVVANVIDEARSLPADLIVLGTHGRGGFERFMLGSVTEKVLRKAPCPVLTVPPAAPGAPDVPQPFKAIICAVDFSPSSLTALEYAVLLAGESGKRLILLHVFDWDEERVVPDLFDQQTSAMREEHRRTTLERMRALVPDSTRVWCECRELTATGRPHEKVVEVASDEGADLIVMGVHGRRIANLLLFGSTTNQVVRHAACPVLTVRAK